MDTFMEKDRAEYREKPIIEKGKLGENNRNAEIGALFCSLCVA